MRHYTRAPRVGPTVVDARSRAAGTTTDPVDLARMAANGSVKPEDIIDRVMGQRSSGFSPAAVQATLDSLPPGERMPVLVTMLTSLGTGRGDAIRAEDDGKQRLLEFLFKQLVRTDVQAINDEKTIAAVRGEMDILARIFPNRAELAQLESRLEVQALVWKAETDELQADIARGTMVRRVQIAERAARIGEKEDEQAEAATLGGLRIAQEEQTLTFQIRAAEVQARKDVLPTVADTLARGAERVAISANRDERLARRSEDWRWFLRRYSPPVLGVLLVIALIVGLTLLLAR